MRLESFLRGLPVKKAMAVMVATGFLLAMLLSVVGAAPPKDAGAGEATFQQKCVSCHTIGSGNLVGPDLKGVTVERDADWLARWLAAPDKMLADGDPVATELLQKFNNIPMPNLGLSDEEVANLIAYMQAQDGDAQTQDGDAQTQDADVAAAAPSEPEPEPEPIAAAPEGYFDFGSRLFVGELRFENGGPACISCHSVDTVRGMGGGTLGPNLTHVHNRYGDAGLDAALKSLPFPTMQGVFADRPLTDGEVADLKAFLAQTDLTTKHPVSATWFVVLGIIGAIVFMGLGQAIWMKRLQGVRKPLVGR